MSVSHETLADDTVEDAGAYDSVSGTAPPPEPADDFDEPHIVRGLD